MIRHYPSLTRLVLNMSSYPKVIFVGINPSDAPVTNNSTWKRFTRWLEELEETGIRYFSFTNLHHDPQWDGKTLSGEYQKLLRKQTKGYDLVIALGNKPYEELKKIDVDSFKVPHPSPRNRVWNDKNKEREVIEELKSRIAGINR